MNNIIKTKWWKRAVFIVITLVVLIVATIILTSIVLEDEMILTENGNPRESSSHTNGAFFAALNTADYANITTDNNWLNVNLIVNNDASNSGSINVRILDEAGAYVGKPTAISPGGSGAFAIPFDAGMYTIQAQALTANSEYVVSF